MVAGRGLTTVAAIGARRTTVDLPGAKLMGEKPSDHRNLFRTILIGTEVEF